MDRHRFGNGKRRRRRRKRIWIWMGRTARRCQRRPGTKQDNTQMVTRITDVYELKLVLRLANAKQPTAEDLEEAIQPMSTCAHPAAHGGLTRVRATRGADAPALRAAGKIRKRDKGHQLEPVSNPVRNACSHTHMPAHWSRQNALATAAVSAMP